MITLADQQRAQQQFDALCASLRAEPDDDGECWMDCPVCGKNRKHFSFSERGYKCFACGFSGRSLVTLAEQLQVSLGETRQNAPRLAVRAQERRRDSGWGIRLGGFCEALDRLSLWQSYKPLTLDSIARYRLGVGKLPMYSRERRQWYDWPHRRLIVPVFDGAGHVVAFHGRAISAADTGAKWLSASGSDKRALMVVGDLRSGCSVVIVENYADAILAAQIEPGYVYLPIGGVTMWQEAWTARLVAVRPRQVLVWLDHDLSGNGSRWHHQEMLATWRKEMELRRAAEPRLQRLPFPADPEPNGPKIANELLMAGLRARVYEWPKGTPWKQDIGAELVKASRG